MDSTDPKAVVVHAGARDAYQVARALREANLLQTLVTDVYVPVDKPWFMSTVGSIMPSVAHTSRFDATLGSAPVQSNARAVGAFALMKAMPRLRLKLNRYRDHQLGRTARRIAVAHDLPLWSYNYYASEAFRTDVERPKQRFLFQLQADSRTLRRIYLDEIERTPGARASLMREKELYLSAHEYQRLCDEPHLANGWVATCSFAANTLAEHGIPAERIHVVPYGVDTTKYDQRTASPDRRQPFRIIFVGNWTQRKGISYLLDAVRLLKARESVTVVLCTRGFIDKAVLDSYPDIHVELKVGISGRQLVHELYQSDVFVFPSLAEGFALVILEAMACGLPVIATDHTCAPDVMNDGEHGFIIPIQDAQVLAEKLAWSIDHRDELAAMGQAAALQARLFTWERFRAGVREAYTMMVRATR